MRDWDNDLQSEREIMSGNSSTNVRDPCDPRISR